MPDGVPSSLWCTCPASPSRLRLSEGLLFRVRLGRAASACAGTPPAAVRGCCARSTLLPSGPAGHRQRISRCSAVHALLLKLKVADVFEEQRMTWENPRRWD